MMTNIEILEQVDKICGNKMPLGNGWYHFVYHNVNFVMIPDRDNETIRFSIPHLAKGSDYEKERLGDVINETNKAVKYIKVIVLANGSISLNYDHRINEHDDASDIVKHMIKSLYYVSEYLSTRIASLKKVKITWLRFLLPVLTH